MRTIRILAAWLLLCGTAIAGVAPSVTQLGATSVGMLSQIPVALPSCHKLGATGDSIVNHDGVTVAAIPGVGENNNPSGIATWATALLGQRVTRANVDNFGVSGQTTQDIVNKVPAAITQWQADGVDCVFVDGGTNDPGSVTGSSTFPDGSVLQAVPNPQTSVANILATDAMITDAGFRVFRMPVTPRTIVALNNAWNNYINNAVYSQDALLPGVTVINLPSGILGNPNTGVPNATYYGTDAGTTSLLHPNPAGAYVIGQALATAMAPYVGEDLWPLFMDGTNVWDAVTNTTGNHLKNPSFLTFGSVFTSVPAGVYTGVSPTLWQTSLAGKVGATYTGTLVGSAVARTDTIPGQIYQIQATALSGGNATDAIIVNQNIALTTGAPAVPISPAPVSPGDAFQLVCQVSFNNTAGLVRVGLSTFVPDGSGNNLNSISSATMEAIDYAGWPAGQSPQYVLRTPRQVLNPYAGTSTRNIQAYVKVEFDTATAPANFTVQVGPCSLQKVP